jgi:hypothetical protein
MEHQRLVGLIDQCRDVADIDGLAEVDKLPRVAQPVEKAAEGFVVLLLLCVFHGCPIALVPQGAGMLPSVVIASRSP